VNAPLAEPLLLDAARRLARQYGLDLGAIGPTVLGAALAEFGQNSGLAAEALAAALEEPAAIAALFNALPVGLSWIDRDAAQLKSAAAWALSEQRPLRVLSAPCARGEEVWSLAAACLDAGLAPTSVQIVGIDAMPAAIAQAELGEYAATALAGRPESRPWWLLDCDGKLVVHPRLRPLARFRVANLLDPAALDDLGTFDLILSRNFLIYLTPEARARWCRTLAERLHEDGRLYLAVGEPLTSWSDAFASIPAEVAGAYGHAAARVRSRESTPAEPPPSRRDPSHPVTPVSRRAPPIRPAEDGIRPVAPALAVTPAPAAVPPSDPRALADAGELKAAEALLTERLARPVPAAEDLVTAALIALARGQVGAAEDALRRALFLDHRQVEASTLLAALRDQRGDPGEAARLRQRSGARR
jgi:chemotaxis methyl-accepting protein methylase